MNISPNVTVRKQNNEKIPFIIWSYLLDRYFISKRYETNKKISKVIDNISHKKAWSEGLPDSYVHDFAKIGFDDQINVLDLDNMAPLDCYFDYTWSCNLSCSYCYNRERDRKITMSEDDVHLIFSQLASNGIMRVHLAGGEPFISKEGITDYVNTAKTYGIGCSVNCNGTFLDKEICEKVFDAGIKTLTISVDGYNESENDFFRGKGNFVRAMNGTIIAVDIKREMKVKTLIQLKAVWTFDTPMDQFEGLVKLAIEKGTDVMQFHNPERCEFHLRGYYGRDEYINGYYERLIFIDKLRKKYSREILIWNVWNPIGTGCCSTGLPGGRGCVGGQELIAIQPNGDMYPCLMNRCNFGNIFSDWGGDIKNFLQFSIELAEFRQSLHNTNIKCEKCDLYSNCRGGCNTRIKVEYGKINGGIDPLCPKKYMQKNPFIKIEKYIAGDTKYFFPVCDTHSL